MPAGLPSAPRSTAEDRRQGVAVLRGRRRPHGGIRADHSEHGGPFEVTARNEDFSRRRPPRRRRHRNAYPTASRRRRGDHLQAAEEHHAAPERALLHRLLAAQAPAQLIVNFTTNEGDTDDGDERVIYSAQATTRPKGVKENGYCFGRGKDYKSCMFVRVGVCYNHSRIGLGPESPRRIDWLEAVGKRPNGSSLYQSPSVSLWKRPRPLDETSGGLEVNLNCDPAPPGAARD